MPLSDDESADPKDSQESPPKSPRSPPLVAFETLAQGSKEVLIDYQSQIYRLRVTRNGKLILNK